MDLIKNIAWLSCGFLMLTWTGLSLSLTATGQTAQTQSEPGQEWSTVLRPSDYQVDFTPVILNGSQTVYWDKEHLVSFGLGLTKEPVTLYDRTGKWLFEAPLTFPNAIFVYTQGAAPTTSDTAVVAASIVTNDSLFTDLIAEVGPDGIRHVLRTSPFYPEKICATDKGTIWAYGKELNEDRRGEPRAHYPTLREYSFDKGELKNTLDRATVRPPVGVPLNEDILRCGAEKILLISGATNELLEYDLAAGTLARWPTTFLPNGSHITGAAVTHSGDVYVSIFKGGRNAFTQILHLQVNSKGAIEATAVSVEAPVARHFVLLGSDRESLLFSQGPHSPRVFWSEPKVETNLSAR